MENNAQLIAQCEAKAEQWLAPEFDEQTRKEVKELMENTDKTGLIDAFYKDLEFGTGGLRGIMGAGSNRMNIYTVGMATQGLANYLKKNFANLSLIKVAVCHDCRNNSRLFAETVANIFSANGIKVYLFDDMRPTPECSFAIRHFGCQSGVNITASHNPREYNGYKAYWEDGAQVLAPHDKGIIDEVNKVKVADVKFKGNPELIEIIGEEIDKIYLEQVKTISIDPAVIERHKDLKIVYTPLHGTGMMLIPQSLKLWGFENVHCVKEQMERSGDFPTVVSPNPENGEALTLALRDAKAIDADIITNRIKTGKLKPNDFIVKTIVTTEVIKKIADKNNIEMRDCYTGFKWIANEILKSEGKQKYIGGGEESYGFLADDFVRDKDAVSACSLLAEICAYAKDQGKTLYELLMDIYLEYGFSHEFTINVVKPGKSGADEIKAMMENFRTNPPKEIAGSKVVISKDFQSLEQTDANGVVTKLDMPETSNVLQWFCEDGTKVSVRPSGTEPKIKFYLELKGEMKCTGCYERCLKEADAKIDDIKKSLGL